MTSITKYSDNKYRILELLKELPYKEYKVAKKKLPIALDISKRTFERWLYTKLHDKNEIPADKLAVISVYLNLDSMNSLFNYEIKQYNAGILNNLPENSLVAELGLFK